MDTNTPTQPVGQAPDGMVTPPVRGPRKVSLKSVLIVLVVVVLLALVYYYRDAFVAATVDGRPISRLSIVRSLEKQYGNQALQSLINQKLIQAAVDKAGVTISREELDAEIKKYEDQLSAQGLTLDGELRGQNMTRAEFEKNVTLQKRVEKLLEPKTQVTDEEVTAYLTANKVTIPEGKDAEYRAQAKEQLKGQKFGQEAQAWINELKTKASVKVFVKY